MVLLLFSTFAVVTPVTADDGEDDGFDFNGFMPFGSTQRCVLAEQFTAGGCGFCPPVSGGLGLMEDNYERDEFVTLAYHGAMGNDPLVITETGDRMSFYGVGGYPTVVFDGREHKGGGGGTAAQQYAAIQGFYNTRSADSSILKLTIEGDLDSVQETGSIDVNISVLDTHSYTDLKLHVVVFENDIYYDALNGEDYHNFVVRDMLDGSAGKSITLVNGNDYSYHYDFSFPTYEDAAEIGVIAFVQTGQRTQDGNFWDAHVLQSAYVNVIPVPNIPPALSGGQLLTSSHPTEDDDVTFQVFYRDTDDVRDNGPDSIKVFYKNATSGVLEHDLEGVHGTPWTAGRMCFWTTTLGPGTYTYRFNASDGEDFALGDNLWNATEVTIYPRNKIPQLMSYSYAPLRGDTTTKYRFDIMYRDGDSEAPASAKIFINGVADTMMTDSSGPFNDWVTYYYETTLPVGDTHKFYYEFSDGVDSVRLPAKDESPNWIRGPEVEPPNNEPTLTTALYNPNDGTRMTDFTFSVIYTDGENDHPTVSYIYVDGVPAIMDPDSYNYVNGVRFSFRTKLDLGTHMYYFMFNDGKHEVRFPAAGVLDGPEVTNLDPEALVASPTNGVRYTPTDYIAFSAVGSEDPENDELEYKWMSDLEGTLSTLEAFDKRLIEGTHVISLTVTDEFGGEHTSTVTIEVRPYVARPFIVGVDSSIDRPIEKDTIRYTVEVSNDGEARYQGLEVRFLVDGALINSDTVSVDVEQPVEVRFTWIAEAGSHDIRFEVDGDILDLSQQVDANAVPIPVPDIQNPGGLTAKYKTGDEIYFKANATDANEDALTYLWDFGDSVTATQADPSHIYNTAGTYTVTVTVTDARGGVAMKTFEVVVTKPSADDSPGFGVVFAMAALVVALLGATAIRRKD